MATGGARRRPQKYPVELRERAVRMVLQIRQEPGDHTGVIGRVAKQLGIGTESLRLWVKQAEIDGGRKLGRRPRMRSGSSSWNARTGSCVGRTTS